MSIRPILKYPDPRLRVPATAVHLFDAELERLTDDMLETMYDASGIGLAATQINVQKSVVVIDLGEQTPQPEVLINPSYQVLEAEQRTSMTEGCLSVPYAQVSVLRFAAIEFHYQNLKGEAISERPDGLRALCLQHELDHLYGRMLVDYLSSAQRARYKKHLQKTQSPQDAYHLELVAEKAPMAAPANSQPSRLIATSKI
ncbi:MAG: peptide deformylase [Gammaproteobacteria bacterium]